MLSEPSLLYGLLITIHTCISYYISVYSTHSIRSLAYTIEMHMICYYKVLEVYRVDVFEDWRHKEASWTDSIANASCNFSSSLSLSHTDCLDHSSDLALCKVGISIRAFSACFSSLTQLSSSAARLWYFGCYMLLIFVDSVCPREQRLKFDQSSVSVDCWSSEILFKLLTTLFILEQQRLISFKLIFTLSFCFDDQ